MDSSFYPHVEFMSGKGDERGDDKLESHQPRLIEYICSGVILIIGIATLVLVGVFA